MKTFAAGIATETNTFSPVPMSLDDFIVQRGQHTLRYHNDHPSLDLSAIWGRQAKARAIRSLFSRMAFTQPSGVTTKVGYETLRDAMLTELRGEMPVDVVLLMKRVAMVA